MASYVTLASHVTLASLSHQLHRMMGAKACDEKGGLALSIASPHLRRIQRLSVSKACKSSCIGDAKALLQENFHDSFCPERPCIATGLRPHLLHLLGPSPKFRAAVGTPSMELEGCPSLLCNCKRRLKYSGQKMLHISYILAGLHP